LAIQESDAQLACGEAFMAIENMRGTVHRDCTHMISLAEKGKKPSVQQRLLLKCNATVVPTTCAYHAKQIFESSGSVVLFDDASSLQRIYRNLLTVRSHIIAQFRLNARTLGAQLLGLPCEEQVL
jgi:hypothetical protein